MNLYDAIMKAADHIEHFPHEFNFNSCRVPSSTGCGTPGCAIGWITLFVGGEQTDRGFRKTIKLLVGKDDGHVFYGLMDDLAGYRWIYDAEICARGLRLYAAKYHAPVATPDWNALASAPLQEPVNV